MDKMYPDGRRKLARTGMRNKLFILHGLSVDIIAPNNQIPVNTDISQRCYTSEIQHNIDSTSACDNSLSPTASITDIGQLK